MRFSQFKHGQHQTKHESGRGLPNLMAKVGMLANFRTGGGANIARTPRARLNLTRRVHARMIAEGKIIQPLDEAML